IAGEPYAQAQALPVLVGGRVADVLTGPNHLEVRRTAGVEQNPTDLQVFEIEDCFELDDGGLLHLAVGVAIDAIERAIPRVEFHQRVAAGASTFTDAHNAFSF